MKIIDYPIIHIYQNYEESIKKQVDYFSKKNEVKSIYQIGSITDLGISDIDLVIIFKDEYKFDNNPRLLNDKTGNYLFTHNLFGTGESNFIKSLNFTFFHRYKLLYGLEFNLKNNMPKIDQSILKQQIALEYLVKMFINLSIVKSYKIIKLRALFLHLKALLYDFEFLSFKQQRIIDLIEEGLYYRTNWFSKNITDEILILWFEKFYNEFLIVLELILKSKKLFFDKIFFQTGKNIFVNKNKILSFSRKGFIFPFPLPIVEKKTFNIYNKLNKFVFEVPFSTNTSIILDKYLKYNLEVHNYNKKYLPYFLPMSTSLNRIV